MVQETRKNILGKTKAIFIEEVKTERWTSWIRLGLGLLGALVFTIEYRLGLLPLSIFCIQFGCMAVLSGYSAFFILYFSRPEIQRRSGFLLVFFDVTIVTYLIWSFFLNGASAPSIHSSLFCAYFIAIAFTALNHRARYALFGGALAVIEYSFVYFYFIEPRSADQADSPYGFILRIFSLMLVAYLGGFISRKNYRTIHKMVRSEMRYQNLVHRLPEMLFTIDQLGVFTWANTTCHTILGIPAKSIIGRNLREFIVSPKELRLRAEGIRETLEIKDFEGAIKFVECTIRPADPEDKKAAWEGILSDITDRETAISQREIMSNRLFQYQKMESLGTLASGMAHDFNNILQTVNDMVSMVKQETNEQETNKRMDLMAESLAEAKFLVSELFALGRKKPLDYKPISIRHYFEHILPLFRNQLGPQFEIVVRAAKDPLYIQGDPEYLKRVFQNLIGNSRDAMPSGGKITIECFAEGKENSMRSIVIRFIDTGTGMPSELTESVFDPFFTTKKPGKGTGLGLALVRRIVNLHKGHVFIERTSSAGTVFRIEFPESEGGATDTDTTFIMLNRLNSRILLLDDDAKIRDILKVFVKSFGHTVCESGTAEEAETELRKYVSEVSIVMMDWRIGADDPHQAIAALRSIKPELVIMVVSGYPPQPKSIEALKIDKWFTKPYDKNVLDLEIQRALFRIQKTKS